VGQLWFLCMSLSLLCMVPSVCPCLMVDTELQIKSHFISSSLPFWESSICPKWPSVLYGRVADNHSPIASRIQDWQVIIQTPLASLARVFFPVTGPFYIFLPVVFWASKNTELLACLASFLKNLFTPLYIATDFLSPLPVLVLSGQCWHVDCVQREVLWKFMSCTNIKDLQLDEKGKIGYTYKSMGSAFWALKQDNFRKAIQKVVYQVRVLLSCRFSVYRTK
jgi:hypothetical protein